MTAFVQKTSSSETLSEKVRPALSFSSANLIIYSLGAFGLVKVGWLRSDPSNKYAIKSMKKHEIIQSKHVDHIENEKNILQKMDHPFGVSVEARESPHC